LSVVATMIVGAGAVLAVLGISAYAQERGWILRWWHWALVSLWGLLAWFNIAWLGTMYGEGEVRAAWIGFSVVLFFVIIFGVGIYRLLSDSGKVEVSTGAALDE